MCIFAPANSGVFRLLKQRYPVTTSRNMKLLESHSCVFSVAFPSPRPHQGKFVAGVDSGGTSS